jgi:hypothetical protein
MPTWYKGTDMNIIEYATFGLFILVGMAVFIGGLPGVRKELDEYQQSDK